MEENKKRVSVAMAAYNGLPYIREQVISILKNLTAEDELVISDDGSTDKTRNFWRRLQKRTRGCVWCRGREAGSRKILRMR